MAGELETNFTPNPLQNRLAYSVFRNTGAQVWFCCIPYLPFPVNRRKHGEFLNSPSENSRNLMLLRCCNHFNTCVKKVLNLLEGKLYRTSWLISFYPRYSFMKFSKDDTKINILTKSVYLQLLILDSTVSHI